MFSLSPSVEFDLKWLLKVIGKLINWEKDSYLIFILKIPKLERKRVESQIPKIREKNNKTFVIAMNVEELA